MPSVYDLKPKFQDLLRPLVTRLADHGVCVQWHDGRVCWCRRN